MGKRSVYFPDELEPLIDAAAVTDDRNFSSWVSLVCKRALNNTPPPRSAVAEALAKQAKLNADKDRKSRKAGS